MLMCWSESQTNEAVKASISGFQMNYRAGLRKFVAKLPKRGELELPAKRMALGNQSRETSQA
jgi:hypothetical protein